MLGKATRKGAAGVRDRLLKAADRLFYSEGIGAVGIDLVLAEADAAKASLYSHFSGKDDLIAAYVGQRIEHARALIDEYVAAIPPEDRAVRVFDYVVEWASQSDFRGCPVQHAVSELTDIGHPARSLAADQRRWLLSRFTEWATLAGAPDSAQVAGALLTLFDGAVSASEQDGPARAKDARWAAVRLIGRPPAKS